MRAVLFDARPFGKLSTKEKVRACYQHAVRRHLAGDRATNSSLRARFGVDSKSAAAVSRAIGEAKKSVIKLAEPDAPKAGYVPFWA